MQQCILIVDDDREIVKAISIFLQREQFQVRAAYDGIEALDQLMQHHIDLVVMDVMMPRMDGLAALTKMRLQRNIPVILLSAKSEDHDKILGLSIGADDYVTKPFHATELVLRIKSLLRRSNMTQQQEQGKVLCCGALQFDVQTRQLIAHGQPVKLTAIETKIVQLLMQHPGRIFPAEEIYDRVWEQQAYSCENTVMVHIRRIREKIELNPKEPEYLKVVWGIGYKMEKK